ncbi:sugar/nucleoside kinase (ribokinase family) [Pedobacter sp. CG_S7]|uniref:PfkB family carbohydrate kinase n=1 Tax=Pedobacter sp. CG_S7 TaxID=3143930 RepID=UPI00339AA6B1
MVDICCIGHITSDKVVTTSSIMHMAGGTAYYFSYPFCNLDVSYLLVTALAAKEMNFVTNLRSHGIEVLVQQSKHTVNFENIYSENQDHRTQNVLQQADSFTEEFLFPIQAQIFHLGPLLPDDIPVSLIKMLSAKARISLDVQGYLREVIDKKVYPRDWPEKIEALQYIDILKADEGELIALTGCEDVRKAARIVADWGVKEVVITNGSQGSFIFYGDVFYTIPAFPPKIIVDATGCGDTYMAGYLYQRIKGAGVQQAGIFAADLASRKMEFAGPFNGAIIADETGRLLPAVG